MLYAHSGRFPPHGPLVAVVPALVLTLALSWLYAAACAYIPLVGYVTVALTAGFGALVGLASSATCRFAKIRSFRFAQVLTACLALVALWSAWCAWATLLLARLPDQPEKLPLWHFHANPAALLRLVSLVYEHGTWSIAGSTPTGPLLAACWLLEAGIVLFLPSLFATRFLDDAFCETCERWCPRIVSFARIPRTGAPTLIQKVEARDWAGLVGPVSGQVYCRLDLHVCDGCGETCTLTASDVVVGRDARGNPTQTAHRSVDKVVVSADDVEALREALRAPLRGGGGPGSGLPPGDPIGYTPPPEERARQEKLIAAGKAARVRAGERRRADDARRDELVPNDGGLVYGPTRAEIVLAALRTAAYSPLLLLVGLIVGWLIEGFFGSGLLNDPRIAIGVLGTTVVLGFLIPLVLKLGPRHLRSVRPTVFEKGSSEPYILIVVLAVYAAFVIASIAVR